MTTELKKEVPYRINFAHPYFKEVYFAQTDDFFYTGPWDKLPGNEFTKKIRDEVVVSTDDFLIKTKKASYKLRNHNNYVTMSFCIKMLKQNSQLGIGNCIWYLFDRTHGPDPDLGPYYHFFIAGKNKIEAEDFCLELKEDIDFAMLESPNYEKESDFDDYMYACATARYWYRRFYKETQTGQIEAIRKGIDDEEEKRILEKEAQSTDTENSQKMSPDLDKKLSSLNRKLSFIVLLLIIL